MVERLWVVVSQELQTRSLHMTANCEAELRKMVEHAADQIRANHFQTLQASQILPPSVTEPIEENLRRFVEAMAQDGTQKGYAVLHEDTFMAARLKLCPGLWPFC